MMSKLIFGILLIVSLSSCDKLNSLSTNKNVERETTSNKEAYKIDIYDPANPEATIESLNKLVKKDKDGEVIYLDKNSPKFSTKDCFFPYLKLKGNGVEMFLKIQHVDVEALNAASCLVTVDKVDHTIEGTFEKKKINGKKHYFVETLERKIESKEDFDALEAIANGEYVESILVGENKFIRKNMSKKSIQAFRNVLNAYIYFRKK